MPNLDIDFATGSDNATLDDYSIAPQTMDGPSGDAETIYYNEDAEQYWGYFNEMGDLKSAFIMKATWNVGKGYKTESTETETILDNISGWGKDTFEDILINMDVCKRVFGDAYSEIITHNGKTLKEGGKLINLKPLNPARVGHVVNKKGRLIAYEVKDSQGKTKRLAPEEMLHFSHNRFGDQIHGISDIKAMEQLILNEGQSFSELQKIASFQAKPFIIFKMKTDNETVINTFVDKVKRLRRLGDDLFIPDDENVLTWEVVNVNPSPFLLQWREEMRNKFYRIIGIPLVLFGNSGSTESGGKMEYFGHEQVWERDQRYYEKQIWNQLGLRIDLISPQKMLAELAMDEQKDKNQGLELQNSDVTAGVGRDNNG